MGASSEIKVTPSAVLDAVDKLSQLQGRLDGVRLNVEMAQSKGCSSDSLRSVGLALNGTIDALSALIASDAKQIYADLEGFTEADSLQAAQFERLGKG